MNTLIVLFSLLVPGAGAAYLQPEELRMWLTVGERRFAITLTDNAAARAFAAQLPLTLDMSELNGNEKHAELPKALPANASRPGTIRNGDLMLYRLNGLGGLLSDIRLVVLVSASAAWTTPLAWLRRSARAE